MSTRLKDRLWIQQSFLLPESALDEVDERRRVLTTAAFKFTDTTLGGNFAINAPPQFTRYADIRKGGSENFANNATKGAGGIRYMLSSGRFRTQGGKVNRFTTPSAGMGRFYSEGIDDAGQDLIMRFGVPEFNSLTTFFANFYNVDASLLARTGRVTSIFATGGRALGFLLALPLQPIILGTQIVRFLSNSPASKYYYMKPTMYPYWLAVNTIANGIAVNLGVIPMALTPAQRSVFSDQNMATEGDQAQALRDYAKVVPDIFLSGSVGWRNERGAVGLDVFAIANRAQRIANQFNIEVGNELDTLNDASRLNDALNTIRDRMFFGGSSKFDLRSSGIDGYREYYLGNNRNVPGAAQQININGDLVSEGGEGSAGTATPNNDESAKKDASFEFVGDRSQYDTYHERSGVQTWFGKFGTMWEAERRDGAQFVTFRVDFTGSQSESFSNQVGDSGIAGKINSTSASARSARFDFADGNVVSSEIIGGIVNAGKELIAGTLQGMHMSGLLALAGNAFVDFPKTWTGSTADLPRGDYTIKLRSPYGTRMSRMMNLYIPMAMLMAAALPLSTGMRSYTSPFICEAYCKGRHAIRLGMIDRLSFTRGVGNLGWTQDGEALGIDVAFSIVDLSSIMHLPITSNFTTLGKAMQAIGDTVAGQVGQSIASIGQMSSYDDDNSFTDYLAVLGSLSWQDLVYANRRWRLARYRQMQMWNSWKSPSRVAMMAGNTWIGRMVNAVSLETDRTD